ncbi:MAG TPA: hypothetical protein VNA04_02480, partial [Thermoanaerobaculia bacterium]|nr:hypothetical protein [Thermoanaerobaculia bacterium]
MRPGPLATITRRITSMWHDPEMRSALAYIALRPHRWSFRRPALIAKRPDYLRALPAGPGTAALPVIDPLLAWGDRPMQCEEFDLRLAS